MFTFLLTVLVKKQWTYMLMTSGIIRRVFGVIGLKAQKFPYQKTSFSTLENIKYHGPLHFTQAYLHHSTDIHLRNYFYITWGVSRLPVLHQGGWISKAGRIKRDL
jgi:hypothetical protein